MSEGGHHGAASGTSSGDTSLAAFKAILGDCIEESKLVGELTFQLELLSPAALALFQDGTLCEGKLEEVRCDYLPSSAVCCCWPGLALLLSHFA